MEPIAIVGMSCRLPGADCPDELWSALRAGTDAVTEVPSDRWDRDELYAPGAEAPGTMSTRWGGFLPQVDLFDHQFFGVSPREAAALDPQQRLLLEVVWEAIDDAGQVHSALAGSDTGVFVGVSTYDYALLQATHLDGIDAYWATGNALSIAANRISYVLDLRGPSLAIDSACSSSLVAVHTACQSIANGESDLAIAAGINVILSPAAMINFSKAGVMAADGRCKTFDARADGYVRGEGAGVVVLKPLARALEDRDPIRAVVRGGAVRQDGRTNGLMAPNRQSQEAVLLAAYRHSEVRPDTVGYVEAHGTGTALGDTMEAQALGAVVGRARPADRPCLVGSIKSNIGHLEAAAGIAGLIKIVLVLENREIPASLHVETENPRIDFERLGLRVARRNEPWPNDGPARAGVSSFGFGGTVAHIVLEAAPGSDPDEAPDRISPQGAVLLPLSARTPAALRSSAERFLAVLEAGGPTPDLAAIAHTAAVRRTHHRHRLAVVADSIGTAADELRSFLAGTPTASTAQGDASAPRARRVVFVCSGQGPRWWPLDPAVQNDPVVRATLTECDMLIRAETGWSLLERLRTGDLDGPDVVQPALFAVQVALARLWGSWGVTPVAVVGHSVGEVAAAHITGALSLADAVRVVCHRGRLIRTVAGRGRMAAIELGPEAARGALRGIEDCVSLAAVNSPTSSVISGDAAAVEELVARLSGEGVFCRVVESVDFASHSAQMQPLTANLVDALSELVPTPTRRPMYSTVTGLVVDGDTLGSQYWAQNLRAPVQFANAVAELLDSDHDVFVELSPHPVLLSAIAQCTEREDRETVLLPSLRRDAHSHDTALTSLGRLWTVGIDPNWTAVHPGLRRPVRLPSYPWQRERHWFDTRPGRSGLPVTAADDHPLLGRHVGLADSEGSHLWQGVLRVDDSSLLDDHRLDGVAIVPAAVWLEMARTAAEQALGTDAAALAAVSFRRMLTVPDEGATTTQVRVRPVDGGSMVDAYARSTEGSAWTHHMNATIAEASPADGERDSIDLDAVRARCLLEVSGSHHYEDLGSRGLEYGPTFHVVERAWRGHREALAAVAPVLAPAGYAVHPALLDAALQTLDAARAGDVTRPMSPEVPVTIDRVTMRPARSGTGTDEHLFAHARLRPDGIPLTSGAVGDVWLTDGAGTIVAALEGVHARPVGGGHINPALHKVRWEVRDRPAVESAVPDGGWLVLADSGGVGTLLAARLADAGQSAVLVTAGDNYDEGDPAVLTVRAEHPGDMARALAVARARLGTLLGAVHLWSLDAPGPDRLSTGELRAAQTSGTVSALHLVQALAELGTPLRLWLVTSGVHHLDVSPAMPSVAQSPLWGLGRVVAFEHPDLRPTLVDLDQEFSPDTVRRLVDELRADDVEDQVIVGPGGRHVARLVRVGDTPVAAADIVRPDATYLITGGTGALGLQVAEGLAERGARHLVLVARNDPDAATDARVRSIRDTGVEVRVALADVGDREALARVVGEANSPPLRGIVHAAGVLDDATLRTLDAERLRAVLEPKVAGGWNLHELTGDRPLDFFVLFSSFAAILGSPGQANYAAANAFLDALASLRAARGQPARSIAWGPWTGTGLAVGTGGVGRLSDLGVEGIEPADGVAILGQLLAPGTPHVAVGTVDWTRWAKASMFAARSPLVSRLVASPGVGTTDTGSDTDRSAGFETSTDPRWGVDGLTLDGLLAAGQAERLGLLEAYLRVEFTRALGMPPERLDLDEPLNAVGLDSLGAVGVKNQVEVNLGISMPLADALSGSTVRQVAAQMLSSTADGPSAQDESNGHDWEDFQI